MLVGQAKEHDPHPPVAPGGRAGGASGQRTTRGTAPQVDFEFFDLAAIDFHGLRALLLRVTDGEPLALSALVELLLAQARRRALARTLRAAPCEPHRGEAARALAAALAQAPSVGTVVKANRDVDPVGVCTVVPLDTQRGAEPVRQVRARARERRIPPPASRAEK